MDPDMVLFEMVYDLLGGDFDEAQLRFDDLRSWVEKGGFKPSGPALVRAMQE